MSDEYKGWFLVNEKGEFKVRLQGDLPDQPAWDAIVALYPTNRPSGWQPTDGEAIFCFADRDKIMNVTGSAEPEKKTLAVETQVTQKKPAVTGRRMTFYYATVVSIQTATQTAERVATVLQEGKAGLLLPDVPVALPTRWDDGDRDRWPNTGDKVVVLLEETDDRDTHTVIGKVPVQAAGDPSLAALQGIEKGVKDVANSIGKALDDWRRGQLGGKR